ncbi:MAG: manganese efflux pump [Desulfitobacterium sp.]|nr:manganese efflux pump [Desulfitobacterium sp.]
MKVGWILALAIALGADAFSLALAVGMVGVRRGMIFRLSLLVAVFHVLMPLGGLFLGRTMGLFLGSLAKALGSLVLLWLGGRMILNVWRPKPESYPLSQARVAFLRKNLPAGVSLQGIGLYALATSVSLDALSVGISLGTIGSQIGLTVLVMGTVAGLMMASGLILGGFIGSWLGKRAEALGGLVLITIGLRMFFG